MGSTESSVIRDAQADLRKAGQPDQWQPGFWPTTLSQGFRHEP